MRTDKPIPATAYLPKELNEWVEREAANSTRTKSQQIVHILAAARSEKEPQAERA